MIPFIDLRAQRQRIKVQVDNAIARVLDHGKFILGPEVGEFESELAQFIGVKHCIGVSNGTDALSVALMALDVVPGDAIITTPFTFFATIEAIMLRGATPVFADIDPQTFNICPDQIQKAIERIRSQSELHLRGILPVDLYGLPADYERINKIAKDNDLFVLQDGAQSCGAIRNGQRAPAHGDIGTVSFFPAKPLGCYGDGGAVMTDDDEIAEKIRSIRVHGKGIDKYDNVRVGLNARLDTIQAAILIEKLKIYPDEFQKRQLIASDFRSRINQIEQHKARANLRFQHIPEHTSSAWSQFVICHPDRDKIVKNLREDGIPSLIYYRTPVHKLRACKNLPLRINLPESEIIADQILALPFHPYLESDCIEAICSLVKDSISKVLN